MKSKVRIIAGDLRGRQLRVPPGIRPSSARLREALMGIWQHRLPDARFLDLFAGSGAVGIEALSRGAREVVLVEGDRKVSTVLAENCAALITDLSTVLGLWLPAGLADWPARIDRDFDLIFADPPYGFAAHGDVLEHLVRFVTRSGQIAIEHSEAELKRLESSALELFDRRRYGDSWLSFFRRSSAVQG